MKIWIKLHVDILSNPRMGRLPDNLWRRFIELCLLAGQLDDNGRLENLRDVAWKLRVPESALENEVRQLAELDMLHLESPLGEWVVTNFAERQRRRTAAERKREQRARSRAVDNSVPSVDKNTELSTCHTGVTFCDTELDLDSSSRERDIDSLVVDVDNSVDNFLVARMVDRGVWDKTARELAALPHCTKELVEANCAEDVEPRLLVWRIREGVMPRKGKRVRDTIPAEYAGIIKR